jgi:hypothetical protein
MKLKQFQHTIPKKSEYQYHIPKIYAAERYYKLQFL